MAPTSPVTLRIEPAVGLLEEHVDIVVEGAPAKAVVSLRASTRDDTGRAWSSEAVFVADDLGRIEVGKAAPLDGSYACVDPMGLFWSMAPDDGDPPCPFEKDTAEPLVVTLEAWVDNRRVAAVELRRLAAGPGVERIELDLPGATGALFRPPGEGPFPAALVLSGSAGALPECAAALLASHGIAAAAVAYFGRPGLPAELGDIPLDALAGVAEHIAREPWVRTPVGVVGTSRGGEAGLLLGVHSGAVGAVVAINGSPVHFQALGAPGKVGPTWLLDNRPLPYLAVDIDFAEVMQATLERPYESTPSFLAALDDEGAVERAATPVEKVTGPVLLIAGEEDPVWPSAFLAERTAERMAAHGRGEDVTVLRYADAGHHLGVPHLPTTGTVSTKRGLVRAMGGTAKGNAWANADAWAHHIRFLHETLGG